MKSADATSYAAPLETSGDLDPLLDRIGEARVVCIGEASHGTHEFYAWRAALTRRLIEERDFAFVAVEGDWPDCHAISRSVTGMPGAPEDPINALAEFDRWPTWMWANHDVLAFTRWLCEGNRDRPVERRVGFYGLDVYSLWESLREVRGYLSEHHPEHLDEALEAFRRLEPYAEDPQSYARATRLIPTDCELEVVSLLSGVLQRHAGDGSEDGERDSAFAAEQNARSAVSAEAYYRAMVRGGPESWNVRDHHMADTLDRLMGHHERLRGGPVKGVVWEHNTHIGDARFTDMTDAGMVNVGQLVRERYGERDTVLVGFASHHGSVIAATGWGDDPQRMTVPAARSGSTEAVLHDLLDVPAALFVFNGKPPGWATEQRPHRAIGVVYRPEQERWGNYVPTVLGRRYDALMWFDETRALDPLRPVEPERGELETWPYGT
jgi:erythromycin esterase